MSWFLGFVLNEIWSYFFSVSFCITFMIINNILVCFRILISLIFKKSKKKYHQPFLCYCRRTTTPHHSNVADNRPMLLRRPLMLWCDIQPLLIRNPRGVCCAIRDSHINYGASCGPPKFFMNHNQKNKK